MLYQLQSDLGLEIVDVLINSFVTNDLAWMIDRQSSGNLFGRPPRFQIIYNVLPDQVILEPGPPVDQYPAMFRSGMSPAGGVSAVLGRGITVELSGHRTFVPTERLGYKAETFTFTAILSYKLPFFLIQMVVLFWHRHLE
jgi:hypothetical protein